MTLAYDPLTRLYETAGGVTTRLAYDGQNLIAEYNGSNALLRRYVHGPSPDEPLVWYEGTGTADRRWLHADERGSIIAVSTGTGSAVAINSYDEYGIPGSGNVGRFQYTGQTWIADIGLYYYKARFYSATLGRFMQTDPIGYDDGMNLYAYVRNDPVNLVDPTGERRACFMMGGSSSYTEAGGWTVTGPTVHCYEIYGVAERPSGGGGRPTRPAPLEPQNDQTSGDPDRKWLLRDGRYVLNSHYVDPAPWLNLQNAIVIPPLIGAAAAIIPEIVLFARLGREIKIGDNFRLAPFGNRTGHPLGRWPHYHYRPSNPAPPGQGIGRHRPWE